MSLQFYPGANRTQWVPPPSPWVAMHDLHRVEVRCTETDVWPEYEPGQAPTFTANIVYSDPYGRRGVEIRQHMPVGVRCRPGDMTNVAVIRVVGTAKPYGPGLYVPMCPAWVARPIVELAVWLGKEWGAQFSTNLASLLYRPVVREHVWVERETA